jgi:hypothetical protein
MGAKSRKLLRAAFEAGMYSNIAVGRRAVLHSHSISTVGAALPVREVVVRDGPINDGKHGRCTARPSILAAPCPLHPKSENPALSQPLPGAANRRGDIQSTVCYHPAEL